MDTSTRMQHSCFSYIDFTSLPQQAFDGKPRYGTGHQPTRLRHPSTSCVWLAWGGYAREIVDEHTEHVAT